MKESRTESKANGTVTPTSTSNSSLPIDTRSVFIEHGGCRYHELAIVNGRWPLIFVYYPFLRHEDFKEAMTQVGASVAFDAASMNKLRRWNEQYGEW